MTTKKRFYAVRKGRAPGIYLSWSGPGGAEEQVKGYPGAIYQGFVNRREAVSFLKESTAQQSAGAAAAAPAVESYQPVEPSKKFASPTSSKNYHEDLALGRVVVFTDGASTGNPGPGGYGVVLLFGDTRKELSGGFRCTTNNRMELLACIVALRELTRPLPVVIYSDSRYVVNAVEKGWARRWQRNHWMRAPGQDGIAHPAENSDLWAQMLDLLDRIPVSFRWVKGHANHAENERCDQLAVQAARGKDLPVDAGFGKKC